MRTAAATRSIVIALALSAGWVGALAVSAQGPDEGPGAPWQLVGRARMGDPEEAAPYQVGLFADGDPERFSVGSDPTFLLELRWRANGSTVDPAPILQLFAYRCEPVAAGCDPVVRESSEVGHVLADAIDGALDGRYPWTPDPRRSLHAEGEWYVEVWPNGPAPNNTALFRLHVGGDTPVSDPIIDILRTFVGLDGGFLEHLLSFVVWLALFYGLARLLRHVAWRTFLAPQRVDPIVGRLAQRLITFTLFTVGLAFSLWIVWRVNFWAGLTALGLLSVALGFGMQNTVANIMGGINLALDKPFVIGDRVQIGDTWGDVQEVGVRSTRIETTKKETVSIPNKLMDEREIWNYTRGPREMRLDVDAGISYDSDRRLAEALMLRVAREHPDLLPYPRPRVLLMEFAESAAVLQLRGWLREAKDARVVASDIRKAIKDAFDEHGVEIPFPYRTLVEKKDIARPHKADDDELAALRTDDERLPKLLYATAGPEPLEPTADLVANIANALDMRLVVAHVARDQRQQSNTYRIFQAFQDAAVQHNVPVTTVVRSGPVVSTIKGIMSEENVDLLVIGSSRQPFYLPSRRVADLTKEIRETAQVPVLIIPRNLKIADRTLAHYRGLIEERIAKRRDDGIGAKPDGSDQAPDENGSESASKADEPAGTEVSPSDDGSLADDESRQDDDGSLADDESRHDDGETDARS